MMRNHHFVFGSDKTNFCSTNEANFISHNVKKNPTKISLLTRSKSQSSVPLNGSNQTGLIKLKSIQQIKAEKGRSINTFAQPLQKCTKDQKDLIFNSRRSLGDEYQSMMASSMSTIHDNQHTKFINKLMQENQKDQFDSLKMSNFNIGNPKVIGFPKSSSKDTFKEHKGNYTISGIYKTGFKGKNTKTNICFNL